MGNCCGKWLHTYRSDNRGDFTLLEKKVSSRPCHWNFETVPLENGFIGGSEVDDGISTHKSEKTIRERAKAAVLASFVADAATMGLHWIYNVGQLQDLLKRKQVGGSKVFDGEFFEPPSCPFYKYPTGKLSPYGFEAKAVLESIATVGCVDGEQMTQHLYDAFKQYSQGGGYLNSPSRELIASIDSGNKYPDAGAFDDQAQGMVKVAAVVLRYAGLPEMVEKIKEAVKTHQNHERAEASAVAIGLVLEKVIVEGITAREAIARAMKGEGKVPHVAKSWIKGAAAKDGTPVPDAITSLGQSCHLPGSFQGPIYTAYFAEDFVQGVRENIMAGGDSCSRAIVAGALLGAQDGLTEVPEAWKSKVDDYHVLEELVDKVLKSRPSAA